uniref:Homeobox domain-containing protein n=2 Tax=Caenorhabditis tropicalis TaxID=1561998 RepID=A0A1I7U9C7_9PELO
MNETKMTECVLITSILAGGSLERIKGIISELEETNEIRLKCEMAIALVERRPQDVFKMVLNLKDKQKIINFAPLILCAYIHFSIDNKLRALNIPPPPYFNLPVNKKFRVLSSYFFEKHSNRKTLSEYTRRQLQNFLDRNNGKRITKSVMEELSKTHGFPENQIKNYLDYQKKRRRKMRSNYVFKEVSTIKWKSEASEIE